MSRSCKARPDVRLDRLENESPDEIAAPILSAAHAYQIGAARDELARHFHVDQDLLRRAPNLLIVSSNGAGFDPVDVDACTAAGVLVVNQSGGNANSVAEHALGMLLTLSKRILEADRALRREPNVNRNALIGNEAQGKTIGIVGLGNVGRRIAELCKGLLAHEGDGLRSLSHGRGDRSAGRREGRTRRVAAPLRFRLDLLPADQGQSRHDRRARIRADAAACLFHHHRARLHSR